MVIVIAGFGSIGRRHARNLQTLGVNDIVVYRTGNATMPEDGTMDLPVETSWQAVIDRKPTVGIIATPTSLHISTALQMAHAGCHMLIEKPLSDKMDGLDELSTLTEQQSLKVLMGFQFRFHPSLRLIKHLIETAAIGEVVRAYAHWGEYLPGWHPWEDYRRSYAARKDLGGGVILTLSHPLDYVRWIMGEVEAVYAIASNAGGLGIEVEDNCDILLQFVSGAIGNVHLDYVQRPPTHTIEIIGQRGTIRWNAEDGAVHMFRAQQGTWDVFELPMGFERNTMFLEEMGHFISCVQGSELPQVSLQDGIRALEIALAIKRSIEEHRPVLV